MNDHATVRHSVNPISLTAAYSETINLEDGRAHEINLVLRGKLVVQIMIGVDRQYTVFDAEHDGVDGAL